MLERAGASLLGMHARTREEKKAGDSRADWDVIRVRGGRGGWWFRGPGGWVGERVGVWVGW